MSAAVNPTAAAIARDSTLSGYIRVSNVANIRFFNAEMKQRLAVSLQQYWNVIETKDPSSQEYKNATASLKGLTERLKLQHQEYQAKLHAQQQQHAAAAGNGNSNDTNGSAANAIAAARPQMPAQAPSAVQAAGASGPQVPPKPALAAPTSSTVVQPNPKILQHVRDFPWCFPPEKPENTPQGQQWLQEIRKTYLACLNRMDSTSSQVKHIDQVIATKRANNEEVPEEVLTRKAQLDLSHQQAKNAADRIRAQQLQLKAKQSAQGQAGGQAAQAQTQGANSSIKAEQANGAAGNVATTNGQSKPFNLQLPGHQPNVQANAQTGQAMNPALDAARNAANLKQGSMAPGVQGQQQSGPGPSVNAFANAQQTPSSAAASIQQQQQAAQQQAAQHAAQQQAQPQAGVQQQQRPALNTQQAAGFSHSVPNVPQSAGPPAPLSHTAAMNAAARGYSDRAQSQHNTPLSTGQQPGSAGPGPLPPNQQQQQQMQQNQQNQQGPPQNFQNQIGMQGNTPRDMPNNNSNTVRMPIPKHLPPSSLEPVRPVAMGQSRPTMANAGPVYDAPLPKVGSILVEGDGGGVLSRDKLAELVREVGGPEESLTPEAEDVLLTLADEFIDNVITAACRLAKLRENPELSIKDIQMVLERNYNMRIPGYSLDEARVVKKFQPGAGWHQKMAAIHAAKVVGGKGGDGA